MEWMEWVLEVDDITIFKINLCLYVYKCTYIYMYTYVYTSRCKCTVQLYVYPIVDVYFENETS